MSEVNLREADRLEVTMLVDNYTDLLLLDSTEVVKRAAVPPPNALLAEHGLSCLLKVYAASEEHVALMDAGISAISLLHNADVLGVDLSRVESVILSHGHFDHFGGLIAFLNRAKKGIPLIVHPDAFLRRRLNIPVIGVQVDFGEVEAGQSSDTQQVTIENTGTVSVDVTAGTTSEFYSQNLEVDLLPIATWELDNLATGESEPVQLVVDVPASHEAGVETGNIIFWAEAH